MKLADFNRLKLIMARTFSDNDHEALAAIRAANKILAGAGDLTWERVLSRTVTVINEVEAGPDDGKLEEVPARRPNREEQKNADANLLAEAARAAQRQPQKIRDAVDDITEAFTLKGFLTFGQRKYMKDVADRG